MGVRLFGLAFLGLAVVGDPLGGFVDQSPIIMLPISASMRLGQDGLVGILVGIGRETAPAC